MCFQFNCRLPKIGSTMPLLTKVILLLNLLNLIQLQLFAFEDNDLEMENSGNDIVDEFLERFKSISVFMKKQEKKMHSLDVALLEQQEKVLGLSNLLHSVTNPSDSGSKPRFLPVILEIKCPNNQLPESCYDINECHPNIYSIMIPSYSNQSLAVSCDLKTENGGWTVIQRRQDGSVNFYRNWTEYVKGFGDVNGEFFIGLEKLHHLTAQENQPQELYILLEDFEGEQRYAKYQIFKIDSKDTDYKLTVGNYSGNAGDCLTPHNGQKFSTWDRDNDGYIESNCAEAFTGAWWYKKCYHSNLNGKYLMGKLPKSMSGQGTSWNSFRGYDYSLKFVQMMIRPRQN